jgi:hypothetical protein
MVNNLGKDWLMGVSHSVGPILFFVQKELREQPHICNCKDTKFFVEIQIFRVKNALYSQLSTFQGVGVGVSLGVTVGGSVGVSVCFLHSLYTKAFQKDWGGSFQKLYEHAAQG